MQLFEFTVTSLFDLFLRFLLFFQWPQHGVWSILDLMGLLWRACALLHVCVIILAQSTHLFKTHLLFVCPALVFGHTLHLCPENNNSCCHPISDICQKQSFFSRTASRAFIDSCPLGSLRQLVNGSNLKSYFPEMEGGQWHVYLA